MNWISSSFLRLMCLFVAKIFCGCSWQTMASGSTHNRSPSNEACNVAWRGEGSGSRVGCCCCETRPTRPMPISDASIIMIRTWRTFQKFFDGWVSEDLLDNAERVVVDQFILPGIQNTTQLHLIISGTEQVSVDSERNNALLVLCFYF